MLLCAALAAGSAPAAAQTTSRPGPWVLDARGVTSPVPEEGAFYPPLDRTAVVPSRGFGLDLGAHVYLFDLGASRVGIGLNVVSVRAVTKPSEPAPTTGSVLAPAPAGQSLQVDLRMVAPQVSFNFGSRDGWSYLSAGLGFAGVISRTASVAAGRSDSGRLNALNAGGGARWFIKSRLAFGFDVRLHKIDGGPGGTVELLGPGAPPATPPTSTPPPLVAPPTPGKMMVTVGAGFSVR